MRSSVKAKFENTDAAVRALAATRSACRDAKGEIHSLTDASGIYSYSGIIPQSLTGTNTFTELFVPAFPENAELSDIEARRSAVAEISCHPSSLAKVTETVIKYGGRIIT